MSCISCQKDATTNEKETEVFQEAKSLANRTGQWVAVFSEGRGYGYIVASEFPGTPDKGYVSPDMPNAEV